MLRRSPRNTNPPDDAGAVENKEDVHVSQEVDAAEIIKPSSPAASFAIEGGGGRGVYIQDIKHELQHEEQPKEEHSNQENGRRKRRLGAGWSDADYHQGISNNVGRKLEPWEGDPLDKMAVTVPPPVDTFYPESAITNRDGGSSYEVTGHNQVYRISTVPADFIGIGGETWPEEQRLAYQFYKALEVAMDRAKSSCISASEIDPTDYLKLFKLQAERYHSALRVAKARADFLRRWPNAYQTVDGIRGHRSWVNRLVAEANAAREEAFSHHQKLAQEEWLTNPINAEDLLGLPIYAMSPGQYESLRQRVTDGKNNERIRLQERPAWEDRHRIPLRISRPNLPPLKQDFPPSNHPPSEREKHRLPDDFLISLGAEV